MNEKDFLRELNSRDNKDGNFTTTLVFDLISQEESGESKPPFFLRLRDRITGKGNQTPKDVLSDNFETIMKKVSTHNRLNFLLLVTEHEAGRFAIKNNFDSFLENLVEWHKCGFAFEKLAASKDFRPVLHENMQKIFDTITPEDILETSLTLSHISDESDNVINNSIASHKKDYILSMYLSGLYKKSKNISIEELSEKAKPFIDPISLIVDELVESEGITHADISFVNHGAYSYVYGIGEKVIKFGAKRANFKFPNHRRILQPLARRELAEGDFSSIIEVSQKVDTLKKEDEDKEKLYQVYKELRDDGIIWADVRFDNIGVLKGPNIPNLRGKNMYVFPEAVGSDKTIPEEELAMLRAGDWVVIDTDHLYKEEEFDITTDDIFMAIRPLYSEFKLRYNMEKLQQVTDSLSRTPIKEHQEEEQEK